MGGNTAELRRDVASEVAANDRGPSRMFLEEGGYIEDETVDDEPAVRFLVMPSDLLGAIDRERLRSARRRRFRIPDHRRPEQIAPLRDGHLQLGGDRVPGLLANISLV